MTAKTTPEARVRALLRSDPSAWDRISRLLGCEEPTPKYVRCVYDVVAIARPLLAGRETEALLAVALDKRHKVIDTEVLTTGTDSCTIVDPKHILRWALTRSRPCSAVVLVHNHPSGDPEPSGQDRDVTKTVAAASKLLGIALLDHVVMGAENRFVSFAERGELPSWSEEPPHRTG